MANVNATGVVVQVGTNGTQYYDMICEIDHTIGVTVNFSSVRTKCDGGTTEKAPGAYDWKISGNAVVDDAPTSTQLSYTAALQHLLAKTKLYVRIQSPGSGSSAGSVYYHQGRAYFADIQLQNQVDGVSQFSFSLEGTGSLDGNWI